MQLTIEQVLHQGVAAHKDGKLGEAERLYRAILKSKPSHPDANHNLGVLALAVNKSDTALSLFKTALQTNPKIEQFWLSYVNALIKEGQFEPAKQAIQQGKSQSESVEKLNILEAELALNFRTEAVNDGPSPSQQQLSSLIQHYEAGRHADAEKQARSLAQEFPQHPFGWKILGAVLSQTGRGAEAVSASQRVVEITPQDASAHSNLGAILQGVGRWGESETSLKQALKLEPNLAESHYNLGITLNELGRLDGAEQSYRQAIALKPDSAEAHGNLGLLLCRSGEINSGLANLQKSKDLGNKLKTSVLLLAVLQARKAFEKNKGYGVDPSKQPKSSVVITNPLVLHRKVAPDLIDTLKEMNAGDLDHTPDPRYGYGRCSDYELFDDDRLIIKELANDLISIIETAVKSSIFVYDSFFNIYGAGAGIGPHKHLTDLDEDESFNLVNQKYSLVYYLSVGDQDCSEPGILKFHDPEEEILPSEGMIVIFPANRTHSAHYGGEKDRVMVGVNFYSL